MKWALIIGGLAVAGVGGYWLYTRRAELERVAAAADKPPAKDVPGGLETVTQGEPGAVGTAPIHRAERVGPTITAMRASAPGVFYV